MIKKIIVGVQCSFLLVRLLTPLLSQAQTLSAEEILAKVREKLNKVNDYEASGKMKTNVIFLKAPIANIKTWFKKPNKLMIRNVSGISFIPKGSVNINVGNVLTNTGAYDLIDVGVETGTGFHIIKLLPKEDTAQVVISTLYIDEQQFLIRKAKTTTKDNGTYELDMTYGRYSEYGLADKIIFSFNTKDYKLPKGVSFDYDPTNRNNGTNDPMKNKKGKVEIVYSNYIINKGVADSVFQ